MARDSALGLVPALVFVGIAAVLLSTSKKKPPGPKSPAPPPGPRPTPGTSPPQPEPAPTAVAPEPRPEPFQFSTDLDAYPDRQVRSELPLPRAAFLRLATNKNVDAWLEQGGNPISARRLARPPPIMFNPDGGPVYIVLGPSGTGTIDPVRVVVTETFG